MHKSTAKFKMPESTIISSAEFKKNPDGSWTCVKNTDIKSPHGIIRVNPGMTFRKTKTHWGIDVAELLDQAASN